MCSYQRIGFLGEWEVRGKCENEIIYKGNLKIEKTGETYKCHWRIDEENEFLGLGMLVDNQLLITRFPIQSLGGAIGLYKPIGDLRSYSALWASPKSIDTIGSGIVIREDTSEAFEGCYKARYFLIEYESPIYDLKINKRDKNDLYSLSYSINNEVKLHAIGMITNGQMAIAFGHTDINCELVILNFDNEDKTELKGKCALLGNSKIIDEYLSKY